MKMIVWVACLLFIGGCDVGKPEWETALSTYKCAADQMAKAESEAHWCSANTGYTSTFCYGSAIIRNCEPPPGHKAGATKDE